jgi:hypothetical protein
LAIPEELQWVGAIIWKNGKRRGTLENRFDQTWKRVKCGGVKRRLMAKKGAGSVSERQDRTYQLNPAQQTAIVTK